MASSDEPFNALKEMEPSTEKSALSSLKRKNSSEAPSSTAKERRIGASFSSIAREISASLAGLNPLNPRASSAESPPSTAKGKPSQSSPELPRVIEDSQHHAESPAPRDTSPAHRQSPYTPARRENPAPPRPSPHPPARRENADIQRLWTSAQEQIANIRTTRDRQIADIQAAADRQIESIQTAAGRQIAQIEESKAAISRIAAHLGSEFPPPEEQPSSDELSDPPAAEQDSMSVGGNPVFLLIQGKTYNSDCLPTSVRRSIESTMADIQAKLPDDADLESYGGGPHCVWITVRGGSTKLASCGKSTHACRACTATSRPCFRIISDRLVLLPIHIELRKDATARDAEYWVFSSNRKIAKSYFN